MFNQTIWLQGFSRSHNCWSFDGLWTAAASVDIIGAKVSTEKCLNSSQKQQENANMCQVPV